MDPLNFETNIINSISHYIIFKRKNISTRPEDTLSHEYLTVKEAAQ